MEYILTKSEMQQCDQRTSAYFRMPSVVLMERAAVATVEEIEKRTAVTGRKILIVAGSGNNGGDGIAMGRILAQHQGHVTVCFVGDREKATESTRLQLEIYEKYGYELTDNIPKDEYDIIIDALFGIGLNRDLQDAVRKIVDQMNEQKGLRVAVDIPSGVCADTGSILGAAFRADLTVTFAYKKRGQIFYPGTEYCGTLICKDMGITGESFLSEYPQMYSYQPDDIERLLPKRKKAGNKGSFGKVLMIAGSVNMSGACTLAGLSAYRTGTGLIRIVTPAKNRTILQKKLPEAVLQTYHIPLRDAESEMIADSIQWADTLLIGPGIGQDETAMTLVHKVLHTVMNRTDKKMIMDADALNILAQEEALKELFSYRDQHSIPIIMTPHLGEFARLVGKDISTIKRDMVHVAMEYAREYKVTLVCKDARTLCTDGEKVYINQSGNDGMATAGSGDVLSGIITALAAQGMKVQEAACLGVYLHGCAGERASIDGNTYSVMARDIIKKLGKIR
ncbi:MAG: NAD(P)H-hydrate dehydratase [Lachnospiraceae bacterium]|nr:NAD(P)H-hydrate dehydratase [Lachnospiraceae bacterium]